MSTQISTNLCYEPQFEAINLFQKQQEIDKLGDLYSIFLQIEHLEKMWIRQCIDDNKYYQKCNDLIIKYKSSLVRIESYYPNPIDFFNEFCPELTSAKYRLIDIGDIDQKENDDNNNMNNNVSLIAETTQYFITMIDALELKICAVDELYPDLKRLNDCLNSIKTMKNNDKCKININKWLNNLEKMKASDKLNHDEIKQIKFDISNAYDQFHLFLKQ